MFERISAGRGRDVQHMDVNMKSWRFSEWKHMKVVLLFVLVAIMMPFLWKKAVTTHYGGFDFSAYWSAVHLLGEGENPYDQESMAKIQRGIVSWSKYFTLRVWNPPILFALLLPFAWIPFPMAKAIWLFVNTGIVIASICVLARIYLPEVRRYFLCLSILVIFSQQIYFAIAVGQVTFLVLLGLASCLMLIQKEQWFWAGAVLILATIKFHMTILVIPYLLLYMAYRKQWRGWIGFVVAGAVCMLPLLWLRPSLMMDYTSRLLAKPPVTYPNVTIGGILSFLQVTEAARYMVFLFLPASWLLARKHRTVDIQTAVSLLTVLTAPTTFYGWYYDQIILMIPVAWIYVRLLHPFNRGLRAPVIMAILLSILINWIQLMINVQDVYFFWVPVFWTVIFSVYMATDNTFSLRRIFSLQDGYSGD